MKELNIGLKIAAKRNEKGVTQEELASFLGVSKPAKEFTIESFETVYNKCIKYEKRTEAIMKIEDALDIQGISPSTQLTILITAAKVSMH